MSKPTVKFYYIEPVPAPRMTRADAWKKRPIVLKYFAFKDEVRKQKITVENGDLITFYLPMPDSWSNKKKDKFALLPHQQKPDIDNLLKALLDAVFESDSHIHSIMVSKKWAEVGGISIVREC